MVRLLGRGKSKQDGGARQVTVHTLTDNGQRGGAAAVRGSEVAIWRPPVMLDAAGRTVPGVSKDLVARYLVATTAALADADLGPVTVEWRSQEGRFCQTAFLIHAWGQEVEIVHPIAPVSQKLADTWETYMTGMASKARELHKGHQRFGEANRLIGGAVRRLEELRDDDLPHFSDGEYLFLYTAFQRGRVLSALVPVSKAEPEAVVGTSAQV
jgi:hypothetical protein